MFCYYLGSSVEPQAEDLQKWKKAYKEDPKFKDSVGKSYAKANNVEDNSNSSGIISSEAG